MWKFHMCQSIRGNVFIIALSRSIRLDLSQTNPIELETINWNADCLASSRGPVFDKISLKSPWLDVSIQWLPVNLQADEIKPSFDKSICG